VSRVDLQVSATLKEADPEIAHDCYSYLTELVTEGQVNVPVSYKLILGDVRTRGDTLYLGSRKSSQFGRLYDKGAQLETAEPGKIWRYEVEYKKPMALHVAKGLRDAVDRNEAIIATVYDWFSSRYTAPIFDRKGSKVVVELTARIHSDEVTLAWLRSQVSPSVIRLMERGRGREVFTALQLPLYGPFDNTSHD